MITVLADKYLYKLSTFLPGNVHLQQFDPEDGLPGSLDGVDALLIRTVTPINEQSLRTIPDTLQFIATGSAGTDHVDIEYLYHNNVAFASAAGCNARSVAEYVITALLLWADKRTKKLTNHTVGIVGVGHAGRAVQELLENLNIPVLTYDPPRELQDPGFSSVSLEEVLQSDILTFHTPLTDEGPYPTLHWLDAGKLCDHSYDLIMNTSRGGVIHEKALLKAFANKRVRDMVIDVWENEPLFNDTLAQQALISTPHIAGYSIQAKLKASKIICDKFIHHFNLPISDASPLPQKSAKSQLPDSINSISEVLTSIHPVLKYQKNLMNLVGKPLSVKGLQFNKLRAEFPLRNEFSYLNFPSSVIQRFPALDKLLS